MLRSKASSVPRTELDIGYKTLRRFNEYQLSSVQRYECEIDADRARRAYVELCQAAHVLESRDNIYHWKITLEDILEDLDSLGHHVWHS